MYRKAVGNSRKDMKIKMKECYTEFKEDLRKVGGNYG